MSKIDETILFCQLPPNAQEIIEKYADALIEMAPNIGDHGMTHEEFWDSGIFRSAVEKLRGRQAASTKEKRSFVEDVLNHLKSTGGIQHWTFVGSNERHDYEIITAEERICIIEAKGCLDGNNTNIFERPPHADEFIVWSLCQNPGADPRHNAWSGIHTRLSAEVMHRGHKVDGVVIWDMICGSKGRSCPKIESNPERSVNIGNNRNVPPPCIYLFPRSIPNPRNNPLPSNWSLSDVNFLSSLWNEFNGNDSDVVDVKIEARMQGSNVQRKTSFIREGEEFLSSKWTTIKRASN